MPMTAKMRKLLEEFATRPLEELTYDRLLKLRDILLNFQFEHEMELDSAQNQLLTKIIDSLEKEIGRQTFRSKSVTRYLIEDPSHVECALATLSLPELLEIESHCNEIESVELRQQFRNMLNRCMSELVEDDGILN